MKGFKVDPAQYSFSSEDSKQKNSVQRNLFVKVDFDSDFRTLSAVEEDRDEEDKGTFHQKSIFMLSNNLANRLEEKK